MPPDTHQENAMPDRTATSRPAWACTVAAFVVCLAPELARGHTVDCSGRAGIELARCERHQKMAAQCGPVKGDAHFACDREFLLANPLRCEALAGDDAQRCA